MNTMENNKVIPINKGLSNSLNHKYDADEEFVHQSTEFLKRMKYYWENKMFCDVILVSGEDGTRIHGHRLVLASTSAYFSEILIGSSTECEDLEVKINNVYGQELHILVEFCYSGLLNLCEDNVGKITLAAKFLKFEQAVVACELFMTKRLNLSNLLTLTIYAKSFNFNTLLQLATEFIIEHFIEVTQSGQFFQLDHDIVYEILKSDDLNVPSEQDVFTMLMAWLQYNPIDRESCVADIMSRIRLPLIDLTFLIDYIQNTIVLNACQRNVINIIKYHLLFERLQDESSQTRPRKSTMGKLLAVQLDDSSFTERVMTFAYYCPRKSEWTNIKFSINLHDFCDLIVNGDEILLFETDEELTVKVNKIDLKRKETTRQSNLGIQRTNFSVATLGKFVYIVGGTIDDAHIRYTERYDPAGRTCERMADLNRPRKLAAIATLKDRIYIIGGYYRSDPSDDELTMECYDPRINKWTMRAPLSRRRSHYRMVASNDNLYVVGGLYRSKYDVYSHCKEVERYDPRNDTWTTICTLINPLYNIACAFLGDRLIVTGTSVIGYQYKVSVEEYDPKTNKWSTLTPMPKSLVENNFACWVIPNEIL